MSFQIDGVEHPTGQDCQECWSDFPRPCTNEGCNGLVHAVFGDENYDGDYWLYYKCTACGDEGEPA